MRLFAEPLPAKLIWDEGELVALVDEGVWKPTGGRRGFPGTT